MAKPRTVSFVSCLVAAQVLTAWIGIEWFWHREEGGPQFDAIVISGYSAISSLGLSFLIGPVTRIANWFDIKLPAPYLIAFRRSLGLLACWFATVHLIVIVAQYLQGNWVSLLYNSFLNTGLLTFALLVTLTISSFPALCKIIGIRLWSELHLLVYAIAVMAGFHVTLSAFAPIWAVVVIIVTLIVLFSIRLLPRRRKIAT